MDTGKLVGVFVLGAVAAAGAGLVLFFGGRWLRARYPRVNGGTTPPA